MEEQTGTGLSVLTWNIHGWKDALHEANGRRIHELIAKLQPDVVALQEVRHPFQRWFASDFVPDSGEDPKANELDLLAEKLGMKCVFFNPGMSFGGNAILTKLPIMRKHEHPLVTTSSGDDRALVGVELQLSDNNTLTVYCTHLDHRKESTRLAQVEQILKLIEEHNNQDKPHLLVGDLNCLNKGDYSDSLWDTLQYYWTTREWGNLSTEVFDRLREAGYKDSWFDAVHVPPPSTPTQKEEETKEKEKTSEEGEDDESDDEDDIPDLDLWKIEGKGVPFTHGATRIDYVLMSRALSEKATVVAERSVPEDDCSDHRPVFVKLLLR